jgi:hypothetical protein
MQSKKSSFPSFTRERPLAPHEISFCADFLGSLFGDAISLHRYGLGYGRTPVVRLLRRSGSFCLIIFEKSLLWP